MPMWNPWHGCHKISAGCKHCYVYREDAAFGTATPSNDERKTALSNKSDFMEFKFYCLKYSIYALSAEYLSAVRNDSKEKITVNKIPTIEIFSD